MKKSKLQQIIKEELQKEIKINKPNQIYVINSQEYKNFYQLVRWCNYWDVDFNEEGMIHFPLNDFDFFYMIYTIATDQQWTPDRCVINTDDLEETKMNYGLDDEEDISNIEKNKQLEAKLKEHSI
jgi:hypothetical protein